MIDVQVGIPAPLRQSAAALYMAAFRQKLTPILGDDERALALIAEGLNLDYAIAALADAQLIGVAGVHDGKAHFANVRPSALLKHFGWWSGLKRMALGALLERTAAEGELLMDGIAVDAAWRGKGVGTALLNGVIDYARERGYRTVRLEVIDTNPNAQRLYQRMGFMAMQIQQTGWLTRRFGFEAVTTMAKVVGSGK